MIFNKWHYPQENHRCKCVIEEKMSKIKKCEVVHKKGAAKIPGDFLIKTPGIFTAPQSEKSVKGEPYFFGNSALAALNFTFDVLNDSNCGFFFINLIKLSASGK